MKKATGGVTFRDKPKFVMNSKDMLALHDACDEAAHQCPQFRGSGIKGRDIMLGEITAKNLLKQWSSCDILFKYGYDKYLTEEAQEIFELYNDYKAADRLWNRQHNITG